MRKRGAVCSAHNVVTDRPVAARVRVAATRWARAVGLLGRRGLQDGEALWIAPSRGVHTCGMRFAIDLVALDREGIVVDCVTELGPWRIRWPRRGTAGVLELAAGAVERSATRVGHRIAFVPARGEPREEPRTPNPEPRTQNPEPRTQNPEPGTYAPDRLSE